MSFARHAVKCCARARARALCRPLCLGPSPGADSVEGVEVQPSELRTQVLGGYRRLMRARTELFAGDDYALQQSRLQLKAEFSANAGVADPDAVQGHLESIADVEDFMRNNLAQGVMNERGSFEVKLTPSHNTSRDESGKLEVNHVDNRDAAVDQQQPSMIEHSSAQDRTVT